MSVKFVVLVACLAVAHGMVRREAPTANEVFADIEKHAKEFQKTFTEGWNAMFNSKSSQDVSKAIKDGSDDLLKNLSAFSSSLQTAAADANGKIKESLEKARENIDKTVAELRKQHPEVEQQAAAMRDRLQAAVQTSLQESQKLAKEISANVDETNKKLAPQFKAAYDDLVKQTEAVQKKIHEAASKQ